MKTYIVDTAAIRENLKILRKKAGTAELFAVLKGDGYGLGLSAMAKLLREEGVTAFAVTEPEDVCTLRREGTAEETILMLRPTDEPAEVRLLLEQDAVFTVASQQNAVVLSGIAREMGKKAKVHLKIDTGMGRYGFLPEEMDKILSCYAYLDCMDICGMYTHFHSAFCNKKATRLQAETLQKVAEAVRQEGFEVGMLHACNSSALMKYPQFAMDAVRVGSALLGRLAFRTNLKKVGYCLTAVEEVRWLPKGHTTGYGAAWKAKKPTRIAVLPVGWYHGYTTTYGDDVFRARDSLRKIFSGFKTLIFGKSLTVQSDKGRCRVLGHVGMLHTTIDITDKPLQEGDTVKVDLNPCRVRGMEIRFE